VLDEDGQLGLATVSPEGLKVLAKAQVLENLAWTPPTLVGSKLYVRDRKTIAAYELGS
jgi:outer membrane protein assembly factor BamB